MAQDVLFSMDFPGSDPMVEVRQKPLMNRTIHWDLCHSHRPQHGGSRILACASRAQFWTRHSSGRVRGVSFSHFFLCEHTDTATSSTESVVSKATLYPTPLSIRISKCISNASAPSSSSVSSWPRYPLFVSVEFVPYSTDRRKLPNQPKVKRKTSTSCVCLV